MVNLCFENNFWLKVFDFVKDNFWNIKTWVWFKPYTLTKSRRFFLCSSFGIEKSLIVPLLQKIILEGFFKYLFIIERSLMSGHGPLIRRNVVHPVSGYQYLGSKRLKLAFLSEKGEIVRSKKKKIISVTDVHFHLICVRKIHCFRVCFFS